ncbi:MAG: hypothetical protein OEZ02_04265 [Anaerolineae bacterium]|nr:hypothetical protein [Anaerolineae bacterium]
MDRDHVLLAVQAWFTAQGYHLAPAGHAQVDLCAQRAAEEWQVALHGDQTAPMDYLRAFEAGMSQLVAASQVEGAPTGALALAVAFGSTQRGESLSYRRALKKYTSSTVFADLNIHLLLVGDDQTVQPIPPDEVNAFLRGLDGYVRVGRKQSPSEQSHQN